VAKGDLEILGEIESDPPGTHVTAYATMSVDLVSGALTVGTPTWQIPGMGGVPITQTRTFTLSPAGTVDSRIHDAVGSPLINKSSGESAAFIGGAIPSFAMPGFTIPGTNGALDPTMIVPLAIYPARPALDFLKYATPFTGSMMVDAMVATRSVTRVLPTGGATVATGLQSLIEVGPGLNNPAFPAAMPSAVSLGGTRLDDDDKMIAIPAGDAFVTLTFASEASFMDDDFLVTLSTFGTTAAPLATLTPIRTCQVTQSSVQIPTDILDNGTEYALKIVGRFGYPGAAVGDYTIARTGSPSIFSTATLVPGTFTIQK
jgi:hypothetical protein